MEELEGPVLLVEVKATEEEGGGVDVFGAYMYCNEDGFRVSCCGLTFIIAVGEKVCCCC